MAPSRASWWSILSSPSRLATFCLCFLGHIASSLNAMPRRSSRPSGSNGQPPSDSDLLLWQFHKQSRVRKALEAARAACQAAGAGPQWEKFAAGIRNHFQAYGITTKIEQSAVHCFEDLGKLAYEVAGLAGQPPDAAYKVLHKTVCLPFASASG